MGHKLVLSPAESMLMADRALKADALESQAIELRTRAQGVMRAAVLAIAKAHNAEGAEALEAHVERAADGSFVGLELRERSAT